MKHMRARMMMFRAKRFAKKVAVAAVNKVKNFVVGTYRHAEAITILTLAALGVNTLLGEVPFYMLLPMWVEATMVIPIIAVLLVSLLVKSSEWRHIRRSERNMSMAAA